MALIELIKANIWSALREVYYNDNYNEKQLDLFNQICEFFSQKCNVNLNHKECITEPYIHEYNVFYEMCKEYYEKTVSAKINTSRKEDDSFLQTGRYNFEFWEIRNIGKGGFGEVFEVKNKFDSANYAVKKIKLKGKSVIDVQNEVKLWADLRNEHIVQYKSAWIEVIDDQKQYVMHIQMELCSRGTLKDVIKHLNHEMEQNCDTGMKKVGAYIASELFSEIVNGINYLHQHKPPIMHRDLKPGNILMTNGDNGLFVKIGDFGLSKEDQNQSTESDYISIEQAVKHTQKIGTIGYMAEEVMTGKYDKSVDLKALGVILSKLFCVDLKNISTTHCIEKYPEIFSLISQLTSKWSSSRPKCSKIIDEKEKWAVKFDQIKLCEEVASICNYTWVAKFYDISDENFVGSMPMKSTSHILYKKFRYELENIKGYEYKHNYNLITKFNAIKQCLNANCFDVRTNIDNEEIKEGIKFSILASLNISTNLKDLAFFIEQRDLFYQQIDTQSYWHCFILPNDNWMDTNGAYAVINWYNCPYYQFMFRDYIRKKTYLNILLINTPNSSLEFKNQLDLNIIKIVNFGNEIQEVIKTLIVSLVNNNNEISVSHLQKNIIKTLKQKYPNDKWDCYIAKCELFLHFKIDSQITIGGLLAVRIGSYCIIVVQNSSVIDSCSLDYNNTIRYYSHLVEKIDVKNRSIVNKLIEQSIGFYKSIHLRVIDSNETSKCLIRIVNENLFECSKQTQCNDLKRLYEFDPVFDFNSFFVQICWFKTQNAVNFTDLSIELIDEESVQSFQTVKSEIAENFPELDQQSIIKLCADVNHQLNGEPQKQFNALFKLEVISRTKHTCILLQDDNLIKQIVDVIKLSTIDKICEQAISVLYWAIFQCKKCYDVVVANYENAVILKSLNLIKPNTQSPLILQILTMIEVIIRQDDDNFKQDLVNLVITKAPLKTLLMHTDDMIANKTLLIISNLCENYWEPILNNGFAQILIQLLSHINISLTRISINILKILFSRAISDYNILLIELIDFTFFHDLIMKWHKNSYERSHFPKVYPCVYDMLHVWIYILSVIHLADEYYVQKVIDAKLIEQIILVTKLYQFKIDSFFSNQKIQFREIIKISSERQISKLIEQGILSLLFHLFCHNNFDMIIDSLLAIIMIIIKSESNQRIAFLKEMQNNGMLDKISNDIQLLLMAFI